MNLELKLGLIRYGCGSQIRAAKRLGIEESKLSRLVQGHRDPTPEERERLKNALGQDYFASDEEGPQAAA